MHVARGNKIKRRSVASTDGGTQLTYAVRGAKVAEIKKEPNNIGRRPMGQPVRRAASIK